MLSSEELDGLFSTAEISTLNFVSSCIIQLKRKLFFGNGILLIDPKKYLFIAAWDLSGFGKPTIPCKWIFHRIDCNPQTHQYFSMLTKNNSKIDYTLFTALLNRGHWEYFILFLMNQIHYYEYEQSWRPQESLTSTEWHIPELNGPSEKWNITTAFLWSLSIKELLSLLATADMSDFSRKLCTEFCPPKIVMLKS